MYLPQKLNRIDSSHQEIAIVCVYMHVCLCLHMCVSVSVCDILKFLDYLYTVYLYRNLVAVLIVNTNNHIVHVDQLKLTPTSTHSYGGLVITGVNLLHTLGSNINLRFITGLLLMDGLYHNMLH